MLDSMPDEPCTICGATGQRAAPPSIGPGTMPCNGCAGKGTVRPFETHYSFAVENVQEFVTFLAASGGFEIW